MKNPFVKQSKLDNRIDAILSEMDEFGPHSPEYELLLGRLEKVMELQSKETWTRRIDPTHVAIAVANLAGIGVIVSHERLHVVTSKAINMLQRTKLNQ